MRKSNKRMAIKRMAAGAKNHNISWAMVLLNSGSFEDSRSDDPIGILRMEQIKVILSEVLMAFERIKNGAPSSGDIKEHDDIAHAIAVAHIRCFEISGGKMNDALSILMKAAEALGRTRIRWEKTGKWGFDGPAIVEISDGISIYEMILKASSIHQMEAAWRKHVAYIEKVKNGDTSSDASH